jgi:hypothetical protein
VSFYPQPDEWSCGPFALKHSLIALGQLASEREIARIAKTHWWSGTDEIRLAKAARAFGCDLEMVRKRSAVAARKELVRRLAGQTPVLLCVDGWAHWIAVLRAQGDNLVVVDSNMDPVLGILTWRQLHRRWRYLDTDYDEEDPPEIYDLHPLVPRGRARMRADFSVARVRYLRRPAHRGLAIHWDEYVGDLVEICRPRSDRMLKPLSMAEFLRRNKELITARVSYWHGDITGADLSRLLEYYRFVAETYGLVVPASGVRQAVIDVAVLATLWTTARRGIGSIYGEGE